MSTDARGTEPDDRRDLGGDPACWAHLFDDVEKPEVGERGDPPFEHHGRLARTLDANIEDASDHLAVR